MKLKDYRKNYNMAPYTLEDFASGASCITDCKELEYAAIAYLEAKVKFEDALETHRVEIG